MLEWEEEAGQLSVFWSGSETYINIANQRQQKVWFSLQFEPELLSIPRVNFLKNF